MSCVKDRRDLMGVVTQSRCVVTKGPIRYAVHTTAPTEFRKADRRFQ